MRKLIVLLLLLLACLPVMAQDERSAYEIALEEIERLEGTNITILDLSVNREPMMHVYLEALPPEIGNLTQLEVLYINGQSLQSLPPEIGNLENLRILVLGNNQLTSLPPEIGNLRKLGYLDLQGNNLLSLPPEIGNLTELRILQLQNNLLTSLPPEIGNLHKLEELSLINNQLTALPPEIGNLGSLYELYLNKNLLSALPSEIGNLRNLCRLDISNTLIEELPNSIWMLGELWHDRQEARMGLYLCGTANIPSGFSWVDTPLSYPPMEVWEQGRPVVRDFLFNAALHELSRQLLPVFGLLALSAILLLGLRWRSWRGKAKKKR